MPESKLNPHDSYRDTPWGSWTVLDDSKTHKVKKFIVKPGQRLSYQRHQKRSEFWIIAQGEAEVTLDDVKQKLNKGESIMIPQGAKHRIANLETNIEDLIVVEVQLGSYFGEDDIERFQDDYGRE